MTTHEPVNILLVDDQPAKLLSYEIILRQLGENLLVANSAREAFEHLLKTDVAVILVDVCMPDLDGFELARMIREHPRFQQTAIIFVSAVLATDLDFLRGYESGAVDYVSVPVIPEILRAKVKIFAELFRKTHQLEKLNRELEQRVTERTAELEASSAELRRSEKRLTLALDAAEMGSWDYDIPADRITWSPNLKRLMGFSPEVFGRTLDGLLKHVHPADRDTVRAMVTEQTPQDERRTCEVRIIRPDGTVRWSLAAGQLIRDGDGRPSHFSGIDLDITARKQAEEHQLQLMRELDHRAKNLLAVVQSVLRLTRADSVGEFIAAVDGRIKALSHAHTLLSEARWHEVELSRIVQEEIEPFATGPSARVAVTGPPVSLKPHMAQTLAIILHELITNAVKYGALSVPQGRVTFVWSFGPDALVLRWSETGGPAASAPGRQGFGTKIIASGIQHQLGGKASFDWRAEGLQCTLMLPWPTADGPAATHAQREGVGDAPGRLPLGGRRILVVEDEALVALMMKDMLDDLGFTVVGPVSTLSQALAVARAEPLDSAILDINLAGEQVYPVADLLVARGIPFVFVTGYAAGGTDPRYDDAPVLKKPIDSEMLRRQFVASTGRPRTQPLQATSDHPESGGLVV